MKSLVFLVLACAGCAVTPAGLSRQYEWYRAGTNVIGVVRHDIVPYVPAPWNGMVEGVLACAAAGLAAWNVHQQRQLREVKNGVLRSNPVKPNQT